MILYMKKVLLTTVYSGFNYGSSLQAFAGKQIINKTGYDCILVKLKSLVKGRDIRLKKLFYIFFRSFVLSRKNLLKTYEASYNKTFVDGTEAKFYDFTVSYLKPVETSWNVLKKMAKESIACFSGSDQIWNSSTLYVDPLYYLRFAPKDKRIALSPSFGRDFISDYNKSKMSKWIGEYSYLSVREDSGVKLIEEMTGRRAIHLLDPTLILNRSEWIELLGIREKKGNYILAYFLDPPSSKAKVELKSLKTYLDCDIIAIPYIFDNMDFCDRTLSAGPKEFVELILNARVVCTDSFHGTAFSINMHTPFFVFEREYGSANKQSERILSVLRKVNMLDRYQTDSSTTHIEILDFDRIENVLNSERAKVYTYVKNSLAEIRNHEK